MLKPNRPWWSSVRCAGDWASSNRPQIANMNDWTKRIYRLWLTAVMRPGNRKYAKQSGGEPFYLSCCFSGDVLFKEIAEILWPPKYRAHKWTPFPMTPCNLKLSAGPVRHKHSYWDESFSQQKTTLLLPVHKQPISRANKWILMTAVVHLSVCVCVYEWVVLVVYCDPGPLDDADLTAQQINLLTFLFPHVTHTFHFTHTLAVSNSLWDRLGGF